MRAAYRVVAGGSLLILSMGVQAQDIVHLNDVIIDGSLCTGFDCVNGESFGFDTIRLKENNLRIKFVDTSSSASFPSNDWQITANDSSNGGANKFSIDDIDGGRTPFTIEAGAPSNSLYVDDGGRLGLGTSTPVVDVHTKSGNTPTLRLEQDGSSGFTPQTWDVAGNEANFFIRDVTNGSTLPFRIRPGAPTSAIDIAAGGDVGIGTSSPGESLHVRRADGTAQVLVEETNATVAARTLLRLQNAGNTKLGVLNTDANVEWVFANPGTAFRLSRKGSGVVEMEIFNNGNVTIAGALTQNSDVNVKTEITEVNADEILRLVSSLRVTKWEYKDARGEAHIGPMAQDFYAAFGLGASETGISTIDTAGVALVAIKALSEENSTLREQNVTIMRQNALLAERLEKLERQQTDTQAVIAILIEAQQAATILTSTPIH